MPSVYRYDGKDGQIVKAKESAGQTFKAGDLVKFVTNGTVSIATAGVIHGIALADASGTTNASIAIELIDFSAAYVAYYKASAIAQTLVGDCLDFTFTVGGHTLDETGATTDVYCTGLYPEDEPSLVSGGRLLVKFYPALGVAGF